MDDILTALSPSKVAGAPKANLFAFFRQFKRSSAAEIQEDRSSIRWHTQVPHAWFNGVLSLRPPRRHEPAYIAKTLDNFRAYRVTSCSWWLETHLQPLGWQAILDAFGFVLSTDTPGMAVELSSLPRSTAHSSQLMVRSVVDLETLAEWSQTFVQGYGIPEEWEEPFYNLIASLGLELPSRHYIAYLYGKPVATSSLFLGAGVAGIYNVCTIEEARGQGIGAIMTLTPLHQAFSMGYRLGVLQSSELGFRVYQRLGFKTVCQMDHFYLETLT
jgi:ribosomal protein S18 acetylase RimI-like enzyme